MDTSFLIFVSTCPSIKTAFLPFLDLISAGLISAATYDHLTLKCSLPIISLGKSLPAATNAALATKVTFSPGPDVSDREPSSDVQVSDQQDRREADAENPGGDDGSRRTPLVKVVINGTRPRLAKKPFLSKKPNVPTRLVPGARKFGPMGDKKKVSTGPIKPKVAAPTRGNGTMALTLREPSVERSSANSPAIRPGTGPLTNRQNLPEEPTTAAGSKEQPDVGMEANKNDSKPTGNVRGQEKKCMNRIKVTHIRLPHRDRHRGFRGDGTGLAGRKPGSSALDDTPDLTLSSAGTDHNCSADPFDKLLTDTLDSLNITSFDVYLPQPSDLSADSGRLTERILSALKPSAMSTSRPSSSASPPPSSPSPALATTAPSTSPTYSALPSSSSPPSSSSSHLSDKRASVESSEPDEDGINTSSEDRKLPLSGAGGRLFRRKPVKSGYMRRPRPNFGLSENKSHLFRAPQLPPPHLNLVPGKETETRDTPISELMSSPSSSASDESSSVGADIPLGHAIKETTPALSGVEKYERNIQTEKEKISVRRPPLKKGYLRRPVSNIERFQNQTRAFSRLLPAPFRPLDPASEIRKEQASSSEELVTSPPPLSKESYLAEGAGPREEVDEDALRTGVPTESRQTLRGNRLPSSHQSTTKVGFFGRPTQYGGRFQNKTRSHLKPPLHPHGSFLRKPFPPRRMNGSTSITGRGQMSQLDNISAADVQGNQSVPIPTRGVQTRQSGKQHTAEVISSALLEDHDSSRRPQSNKLEETTKSDTEDTQTPDSDTHIHKQSLSAARNTGGNGPGRTTTKQTSSDLRHGPPRPVTLPRRQPPANGLKMSPPVSWTQKRGYTKTNTTATRLFDSKTGRTRSAHPKPAMGANVSSSGATREILDNVGVMNRTSSGFTLMWDSPEGKYKNFVVTRKKVGKVNGSKEEGREEAQEASGQPTQEADAEHGTSEDENRVPESVPRITGGTTAKPATGNDQSFQRILSGAARSFQFGNLPPQTEYTVTLLGKGPGLLSKLHKLVISTGTGHSRAPSVTAVQCYNVPVSVVRNICASSVLLHHDLYDTCNL